MKKLELEVFPGGSHTGESFNYIISSDGRLLAKGNLQGDMVHDRLVDVLSPHLRAMSLMLDNELKALRKGAKQ